MSMTSAAALGVTTTHRLRGGILMRQEAEALNRREASWHRIYSSRKALVTRGDASLKGGARWAHKRSGPQRQPRG